MLEVWRDVKWYEGFYKVSNLGRIKSVERRIKLRGSYERLYESKIMKCKVSKDGYYTIGLRMRGKREWKRIHRLVAEAFIENPLGYEVVNHIDGNKLNNNVDNLEWCTIEYNNNHAKENGLLRALHGEEKTESKLTNSVVISIRKDYKNGLKQSDICKKYNISATQAHKIVMMKSWKHI